jgi:tRNA pseudouridine38-40 synthase
MQRFAVGLEYDGTRYCGWQVQPGQSSLQRAVEAALSSVAAAPVATVCAGRTDAGVHAVGQVVHFDATVVRAPRAWVLGANAHLPVDIALQWACPVPDHFHARYSALARTYRYLILNRSERSALAVGRAAWIHRPLDVARMQEGAAALLGEHDFSAFRAAGCQARSPVRHVSVLDVTRREDFVTITITANAYLHHMVRNVAGLLIAIGGGDLPPAAASEVLARRDRTRAPATATPEGLYLAAIRYPAAFGVPERDSAMIPR